MKITGMHPLPMHGEGQGWVAWQLTGRLKKMKMTGNAGPLSV